ncbi:MAG: cupredoxin domain-containing protein [Thermodesulfobacteriota bacterium]
MTRPTAVIPLPRTGRGPKKRPLRAGLLAAALAALCAGGAPPPPARAAEVQRVEIAGGSHYFRPDRVVVKRGVPVELVIVNEAAITPHNFVLKAPEAGIDIKERLLRKPHSVRFVPERAGEFAFYCDKKLPFFKSHRAKGMEGVLVVE